MSKKKLLYCSDSSRLKTGFGRNSREVLMHLWKTGKYEIVEYMTGPVKQDDPILNSVPWKAYGAMPVKSYHVEAVNTPALQTKTRYGAFFIDEIIKKEKPDVYIGVNDFWAFFGYYDKPWWNKFPCVLWITMDSLPLYREAIENAHKIKNFWVWTSFAEKEFKRLGHKHVKTVHGALDAATFSPLPREQREAVRKGFGVSENTVFGFVFRNQLRKLVGSLLEGFKIHKEKNPKAKLLLHTSWQEGWNIPSFIKEFGIDNNDVLTTYVCKFCKDFHISPFVGPEKGCPHCKRDKTCITPNTAFGVTNEQLNLIYNLMDFYIHPITSGGLEMPIVEALMAGVPAATVNYSCGEEFCGPKIAKEIDFTTYREIQTQFIKASAKPESIAEVMNEFSDMVEEERIALGGISRNWASENFDKKKVCQEIEKFLDSLPKSTYNYEFKTERYNSDALFNEDQIGDSEWSIDLIRRVFGIEESPNSETIKKMVEDLKSTSRKDLYDKAILNAKRHNENLDKGDLSLSFEESPLDNIAFITPSNQLEKIYSIEILSDLHKEHGKNFVIICDEIDKQIFSEKSFAKVFIPKTGRSTNIEWLLDLKDGDGNKRIEQVYFHDGNEYKTKK